MTTIFGKGTGEVPIVIFMAVLLLYRGSVLKQIFPKYLIKIRQKHQAKICPAEIRPKYPAEICLKYMIETCPNT